jgi:hypothetical protein
MNAHSEEDGMEPEPRGPDDWVADFRQRCALVRSAAEEWAVRWHEPEGRFVAALLGAIQTFSRLAIAAEATIMAAAREGRAAAEADLARLTAALETTRELSRQGDQAIKQARNAHLAATVQQEGVTQRMIDETLPMFADRLKEALIIREVRWNRERAWKRQTGGLGNAGDLRERLCPGLVVRSGRPHCLRSMSSAADRVRRSRLLRARLGGCRVAGDGWRSALIENAGRALSVGWWIGCVKSKIEAILRMRQSGLLWLVASAALFLLGRADSATPA